MPADTAVVEPALEQPAGAAAPDVVERAEAHDRPAPPRLRSLDVARGIAIAGMMLVEQTLGPPRSYPALRHAVWFGWTAADLVFPAFLVVAGASIAMTVGRGPLRATMRRLARRTTVLIVIGLVFNAWSGDGARLEHLRIPGVLQRIAVAGLIATLIILVVRQWWAVVIVALVLLAVYAAVLTGGHTSCGHGVLSPKCTIAGAVDRHVFHDEHLYHQAAFGYDPEGLLSTMGAVASVLFGAAAGLLVRHRPRAPRTAAELGGFALALWMASGLLWQGTPINKRLWTPPFALFTAAITIGLFALLYLALDVLPRVGWSDLARGRVAVGRARPQRVGRLCRTALLQRRARPDHGAHA